MPLRDFNSQRLFVDALLAADRTIDVEATQANYLVNVLRLKAGDTILVFNGRDGEWRASLAHRSRRSVALAIEEQTRLQEGGPDIDYLFAPLKRARLDYMIEKATELGAARLRPVITRRTIAERVNLERMRANAIEAAEQCGILRIPEVMEPVKLERTLADWDGARRLVLCDEEAAVADPIEALGRAGARQPLAVLVGPEGGFDETERVLLLSKPYTLAISLGPRVMRADTAAIAALALVSAVAGDWR